MNFKDSCDIILPTCGQVELIRDCIESLIRSTKYPYRLIVIDNGNSPEATSYLSRMRSSGRLDMVLIKPEENLGWIRSINTGLELSKESKYVCFQNDDTVFTEGWLDEMAGIFEKDPKIGIANPEWEKPDDVSIDEYASTLKKYKGQTIDMDWCRGHCFFIRREVVDKIGGFDTVYLPVYYDDRDYSLKAIEAGYRCVKAKGAFVYHVRNVTMKRTMEHNKISALMERNGRIFYKRWGYPLRLILILKDKASARGLLQGLCLDQNKVIVLTYTSGNVPYEHTNMTILRFNTFLYNLKVLVYLLTKRSKKQQKAIDFIFTDNRSFYSFAHPLKGIITSDIILADDMASLSEKAIALVKEKKENDKNSIK